MKHLPTPLSTLLDDDVDEARVRALWDRTRAAIATRQVPAIERARVPIGIGTLGGAGLAAAAWLLLAPSPPPAAPPAFLALADGRAPVAIDARAPTTIELADASSITVDPGTRIAPTENGDSRFVLAMERGRARFAITPGGPRRWTIDCGPVAVTVVGTIFTIERDPRRIRVAVERGQVEVSGALIEAGRRQLRAGESIELDLRHDEVHDEPASPHAAADVHTSAAIEPPPAAPRHAPIDAPRARWRSFAERGEHAAAYDHLPPGEIARTAERASARELMLLADVARLSGHAADAVLPLERLLSRHPDDPEAPLAAIILARIERGRGRHRAAADALGRAMALGVPTVLAEEIEAERVVELGRAGEPGAADTQARRYLERHPAGAHAGDVRAWLLER